MVEEMYRVLKKGGKVICTAPMTWPLHEEPNDFFRYTKYGLIYLFESSGFKILVLKERGGVWKVLGQKISMKFFGKSKSLVAKIIKGPFCAGIQGLFSFLDYLNPDYSETTGYTIIAEK